jgi:hypothetical protein
MSPKTGGSPSPKPTDVGGRIVVETPHYALLDRAQ